MKKLSIIMGMILFAAVALFSCKDESGEFVEQLYTNAQKELAIKDCLRASADSALNHLCVADGFYNYNNAVYRIDYSSLQNSLFDTLSRHGYGGLVDSLILHTNRLAENCKAQLAPLFTTSIDSLEIIDYDALIHGNMNAITKYFETYKYQYLKSAFQTPVSIRMNLFGVTPVWNEMNQLYSQYANAPLNFDIQGYVAGKMLDGLLEEMSVEEALIRTDTTHQSESMELFGN
jgi:hypothetical protein